MKRRLLSLLLAAGAFAGPLLAGETLQIDGVTYDNVRWGPVNQGKVVIFHNHGVATIPLEKLPPEIQQRFHYQPAAASAAAPAPPEAPAPGGGVVTEELITETVTNAPTPVALPNPGVPVRLTGFVRGNGELTESNQVTRGLIIELAQKKPNAANVPAQMEMRPGLWKATGQMVFLTNYPLTDAIGLLIRFDAVETGHIKNYRTFTAIKPPAPPARPRAR